MSIISDIVFVDNSGNEDALYCDIGRNFGDGSAGKKDC